MHIRSGELASAYMFQACQPLSCSRSEVQASLHVLLMQVRCEQSGTRNLMLPAYTFCMLPSADPFPKKERTHDVRRCYKWLTPLSSPNPQTQIALSSRKYAQDILSSLTPLLPTNILTFSPKSLEKNDSTSCSFDGAITTKLLPSQSPLLSRNQRSRALAFAFEVTFDLTHPHLIALAAQKPPRHFHPYQEEYIQVLEGRLGVNVEGFGERDIGVEDGEVVVKPWKYHLLYPVLDDGRRDGEGRMKTCRFLLSAEETGETLKLDTVFFQNWYGYQDDIVVRGAKMDLIQVMCVSSPTVFCVSC